MSDNPELYERMANASVVGQFKAILRTAHPVTLEKTDQTVHFFGLVGDEAVSVEIRSPEMHRIVYGISLLDGPVERWQQNGVQYPLVFSEFMMMFDRAALACWDRTNRFKASTWEFQWKRFFVKMNGIVVFASSGRECRNGVVRSFRPNRQADYLKMADIFAKEIRERQALRGYPDILEGIELKGWKTAEDYYSQDKKKRAKRDWQSGGGQ